MAQENEMQQGNKMKIESNESSENKVEVTQTQEDVKVEI